MEKFVKKLRHDYPSFSFVEGERAYWSPKEQQICYRTIGDEADRWALLHELGHALLGHTSYDNDVHLLRKELAAWVKAAELAASYKFSISQEHIENCLDTYRDWLHKRSTCPTCAAQGLQAGRMAAYACLNCHTTWNVSTARFCRPYRLTQT